MTHLDLVHYLVYPSLGYIVEDHPQETGSLTELTQRFERVKFDEIPLRS
jgi:hypothetical protein